MGCETANIETRVLIDRVLTKMRQGLPSSCASSGFGHLMLGQLGLVAVHLVDIVEGDCRRLVMVIIMVSLFLWDTMVTNP